MTMMKQSPFSIQAWASPRVFSLGRPWRGMAMGVVGLLAAGFLAADTAQAMDLPPAVLKYLRTKDSSVEIRFDGLVTFGGGQQYLPVLPQDVLEWSKAEKIVRTIPEKAEYPDFIQFDNNLFLVRLVPTTTGKITLPRMDAYPIELKEGLLPQDLVMPGNLFIPAELKVLLGGLPYSPQVSSDTDPVTGEPKTTAVKRAVQKTIFLSNLTTNTLFAVDPDAGSIEGRIPFNCVPSSMVPSSDDTLLYATCLTTDEVVVVDTQANLIKTRASVGSKPSHMQLLEESGVLVVANQFSPYLSLVQLSDFTTLPETVALPSIGSKVMAYNPPTKLLYVADTTLGTGGKVFEIDLDQRTVRRTFDTLAGISAMVIPEGSNQLWLTSRTENKLEMVSLADGKSIRKIDIGKKPVAMVQAMGKVLIASGNDSRIDVVQLDTETWTQHVVGEPILLPEGSFPSGMTQTMDGKLVYVSAAGAESLYVVDVVNERMYKSVPLEYPANSVALIGGEKKKTVLSPVKLPQLKPLGGVEDVLGEEPVEEQVQPEKGVGEKKVGGVTSFLRNPFGKGSKGEAVELPKVEVKSQEAVEAPAAAGPGKKLQKKGFWVKEEKSAKEKPALTPVAEPSKEGASETPLAPLTPAPKG